MSSLSILDRDLCGILAEMRSDKITQRQKAFEKLESILVNREDDILRYMSEGKFDNSWQDLLEAAHHGIQKQNRKMVEPGAASGALAESKSYIYIKVIQKVVDLAMTKGGPQLKFSDLIHRSLHVLSDDNMLQYFGVCYLQILQKYVLNSKWDLTVITFDEWTAIITKCFELYDDQRIAKQTVVFCLALGVRKSLENSSVQGHFVKYLNQLARMINDCGRDKSLQELIRVAYICVLNLAVDYRYEICSFTEKIGQRLVKAYEAKLEDDAKATLFRLMHLSVLVHNPEKSSTEWRSNESIFFATDRAEWFKCLRNFYFVVGNELKAHVSASKNAVGGREVPFVGTFLDFASRLCYVMFWHDEVWNQGDTEQGGCAKKIKRANKLQSIIDLVESCESGELNWRWMVILAAIIQRCPALLEVEDYQPLLNLLSSMQPKLHLSSQLKAFHICCSKLLELEKTDNFIKSSMIDSKFCVNLWHKITETAFRSSTSSSKTAAENHLILQLLISNRKFPSIAFITGVLNAFHSYSIDRTNANVETIRVILQTIPLDALGDVLEIVEKLFNYLFPKSRDVQTKGILHNRERLDARLVADIVVLCAVTKHEEKHKNEHDKDSSLYLGNDKYIESNAEFSELEDNILLKALEKLIVVNKKHISENTNLTYYNIHEKHFEMLCAALNFEKHILPVENDCLFKGLINIIGDVELYIYILNLLLTHKALNSASFEKCLITKKITFKFQEMELGFERLKSLSTAEMNEMAVRLRSIFEGPHHECITQVLKGTNFSNLFQWIFNHARMLPNQDSRYVQSLQLDSLNKEQTNQHILLLILVHYLKYDGVNTNEVRAYIEKLEFNIYNNLDLFHVFDICKVFCTHKSTFFAADWVLNYLKDICRTHHTNSAITESIINIYSDFVIFVNAYDGLFNDTNTVLLSFIKKANKKIYSTRLQKKIYDQVKYLSRAYPEYYESHQSIYVRMVALIDSPYLCIKMSAVSNLLHLLCDGWVFNTDKTSNEFSSFQHKLFKSAHLNVDDLLNKDEKESQVAAIFHLICGTACNSYHLRKSVLLNLIEQSHIHNLPKDKVQNLLKLLNQASGIDFTTLIHQHMGNITNMWISKGYTLKSIPWHFTTVGSLEEFINVFQNELTFSILCHKPSDLVSFAQIVGKSPQRMIEQIQEKCFAFIAPVTANCEGLSLEYEQKVKLVETTIKSFLSTDRIVSNGQSILAVLKFFFEHLFDNVKLFELCEREVYVVDESYILNGINFQKCLEHFKRMFSTSTKHSLLTYLCVKKPSVIEQTLFCLKIEVYETDIVEEKMIILYRVFYMINQLSEYFSQERITDMKEYLIRDLSYFLCNTMMSCKSLQLFIINGLHKFLSKVIPTCAEYLTSHLNFIVSSLLAIYDYDSSTKCNQKIIAILEMIVIDNLSAFGDGIKKLNYFPSDEVFTRLRQTLERHKASRYKLKLSEDIKSIIDLPMLKYEELAALRSMLVERKDELCELCEELEASNGFSEDCFENVLLKLINILLAEVQSSSDEKQTVEALRCLGEIGPIDLSTMLLQSDTKSINYESYDDFEKAEEKFVQIMLKELNRLLVYGKIKVSEKASAACYHVLQNPTYRNLALHLRTLYPYTTLPEQNVRMFTRPQTTLNLVTKVAGNESNFHSFTRSLATTLLDSLQDKVIRSLAEDEITFASEIVPILIQIILSTFEDNLYKSIEDFINNFFSKFSKESDVSNLETVQLMLKIAECVRINNQSDHRIQLNYLQLAAASLQCQAYFKTILYCELWVLDQRDAGVLDIDLTANAHFMTIMKTAHLSIGVEDAAKAFLDPIVSRSEYYQLERKFSQSLLYYDVAIGGKSTSERMAYAEALKSSHLYRLASITVESLKTDYECAWRMADWNVALDCDNQPDKTFDWHRVFDKQHYKALKCLELKDENAAESAVLECRKAISQVLQITSMESSQNIYPLLCKLRQLQQIEDFMNVQFYRVIDGEQELLNKWTLHDKLPYGEFCFMETILSQRIAILKTARVRALRKWVPDALNQAVFQLIHEARIGNHFDVATANIRVMLQQSLTDNVKALVMLEDAQLNWAIGDKYLSKKLVNEVVAGRKCKDLMINAAAYRIYGTILAETHAEDVHSLHKNFFKQSEALVEESLRQQASQKEGPTDIIHMSKCLERDRNFIVLHTVAKYADREFIRLKNHSISAEFKTKKINLEKLKQELIMMEAEQAKLKESDKERLTNLRRAKISAKQNAARDEEALNTMMSNMENYLKMALLYYSAYTRKSSVESDLAVFRIIALWLGNHSDTILANINEALKVVPTYKFIPVLPQLAPRLNNRTDGIGRIVFETLERCANDHPHHTLPHILAQFFAFADVESKNVPKDDERLLGAQQLHKKLIKNSKIAQIVNQMTEMNMALIEMANRTLGSARGFSEYKMSSRDALHKCKNFDKIHCSTVELKVKENGIYDNIIGVHRWDDNIQGVGGINAPKKLKCHCLDGLERTQLLKGKDDMRQDAVMEQVFNILNVLLRNDREASKTKLTVRTYKVVPLSRQSGILEWCSNTLPIGSWLITAHARYRPKDINPLEARKAFAELAKSSVRTKQEKYLKICQQLHPVFQHFFLEKYLVPGTWFERRLCYTKSVAVSSMIGYILGIGDRHVQNILVDQKSAEVIHIDFGIAFELGKNLPTPETIPFRLTRDIVAGMGVSGIEGVFKKACEKTLDILRNNHAPIMTILEVLLYDPLYTWNVLSNKKAARRQMAELYGAEGTVLGSCSGDGVNISAERALLRVSDKLNGKEDEKFISVEGQVERLIFAATSTLNLCQLFQGWQPYL
ncbi:serine/threonine-protein kinase ATM isoform X2 [Uranotaenia lowii]|uniref:serine/threonine-protein kinase ATM isoform X2 n=1 Tax=Uranotaenia lowii TaxID=190385 RepID=UPI002479A230|nr:serine/threonine-protein kinase ATM isoform X2 [Uranotaenia lowii]